MIPRAGDRVRIVREAARWVGAPLAGSFARVERVGWAGFEGRALVRVEREGARGPLVHVELLDVELVEDIPDEDLEAVVLAITRALAERDRSGLRALDLLDELERAEDGAPERHQLVLWSAQRHA